MIWSTFFIGFIIGCVLTSLFKHEEKLEEKFDWFKSGHDQGFKEGLDQATSAYKAMEKRLQGYKAKVERSKIKDAYTSYLFYKPELDMDKIDNGKKI